MKLFHVFVFVLFQVSTNLLPGDSTLSKFKDVRCTFFSSVFSFDLSPTYDLNVEFFSFIAILMLSSFISCFWSGNFQPPPPYAYFMVFNLETRLYFSRGHEFLFPLFFFISVFPSISPCWYNEKYFWGKLYFYDAAWL